MQRLHIVWDAPLGLSNWFMTDMLIITDKDVKSLKRGEWTQEDVQWFMEHGFGSADMTSNFEEHQKPKPMKAEWSELEPNAPLTARQFARPDRTRYEGKVYEWPDRVLYRDSMPTILRGPAVSSIIADEVLDFKGAMDELDRRLQNLILKPEHLNLMGYSDPYRPANEITDDLMNIVRGEEKQDASVLDDDGDVSPQNDRGGAS
jgi:hypothetical protein